MNAKSNVKVLFAKNVIEINKIFDKERTNPLSDEYALLQKIRADYPDFQVRVRQIKKNAAKEAYPGLTYEYMRDYIILHTAPEAGRSFCFFCPAFYLFERGMGGSECDCLCRRKGSGICICHRKQIYRSESHFRRLCWCACDSAGSFAGRYHANRQHKFSC